MPKLTIDGIAIEVAAGTSILQACEQLGIEVPRFCYHERLSVPANCRMCLVEVERAPKPVASCAMPVGEGMVVKTASPLVHKARNGVMEFLLVNHPLDCPICDQGGECDLQDQAMAYGYDRGRFAENKRAVSDKQMGPMIKTIMTRCIHCTRCIRFMDEIAGVSALGAVSRGEHMEITCYDEAGVNSELSGNLADVCPVGALTSKPYAFTARPWELKRTDSVDVLDAVGSNIRIDTRGPEVMRILPRLHEDVNEEWLADKSRNAIDGLKRQRLDRPYVRGADGKLRPASWAEAFSAIRQRLAGLGGHQIAALAGDLVDAESAFALKELMGKLGSGNLDCRQDGALFDTCVRAGYLFNSTIAGIEKADALLLIGCNPRWEAPLINARIRKRYLTGRLAHLAVVGPTADLTYPVQALGTGGATLAALADGSHPFAATLKAAKNPLIIVGSGAFRRADGLAVQGAVRRLAESVGAVRDDWNGYNVLHRAGGRVGAIEAGFVPAPAGLNRDGIIAGCRSGTIAAVYLLGADELPAGGLGKVFVIYQGHHGDAGAHLADVVLPGAAYTEKSGLYVNTEGRVQQGRLAVFPLGEAKEDWKILRALSAELGQALPFDSLAQLRRRLAEFNPLFAGIDQVPAAPWGNFGTDDPVDPADFVLPLANYYMTDPISRSSPTMARCTESFVEPARPVAAAAE
jgi:NADH-quinone oxidoreductase subunit G